MWKCPCQICRLSQEIYNPVPQKANEKIINLAPSPQKVKPQSKIHSITLIVKRIKKKPSFPS